MVKAAKYFLYLVLIVVYANAAYPDDENRITGHWEGFMTDGEKSIAVSMDFSLNGNYFQNINKPCLVNRHLKYKLTLFNSSSFCYLKFKSYAIGRRLFLRAQACNAL